MTPSPSRVAHRFLVTASELKVPPGLLKDVTSWALAVWASDEIKPFESKLKNTAIYIAKFKAVLELLDRTRKVFNRALDQGDAWEALQSLKALDDVHMPGVGTFPRPEELLDPETMDSARKRILSLLTKVTKGYRQSLREEEQDQALARSQTDHLLPYLDPAIRRNVSFTIKGEDTVYPILRGKSFYFTARKAWIDGAKGAYHWGNRELTIVEAESPEDLARVVRHELQHVMQGFLSEALKRDPKDPFSAVGVGPRKTKMQEIQGLVSKKHPNLSPTFIHDLDDREFHTELSDLRETLRKALKMYPDHPPREVFQAVLESPFMQALASVPEARPKYQIAIRELSRVLP